MRKLIWLGLVALIAGTVYAETSPGFSGSFEFYNTYQTDEPKVKDGEDFVIGNNYEVKIAVNGVIDEWTTVNAEITKKKFEVAERVIRVEKGDGNEETTVEVGDTIVTDMDKYEIKKTGDDRYGDTIADMENAKKEANVYDTDEYDTMVLNEFTMTNDITGALGFADSPVGISLTWGKTSLKPAAFHSVAGETYLGHDPTDSYLGIKIATTIVEKVKVVSAFYPETYLNDYYDEGRDKAPAGAIDVQFLGLVEGLNFNVFYTSDHNKDRDGDTKAMEETDEFGLTAGYTGVENLSLGLATSYDLWKGKEKQQAFDIGVSASYSFLEGRLVPALAVVIEKFPKETKETTTVLDTKVEKKIKNPMELYLGFDTRFKIVPDTLDAVFNIKLPMRGKKETTVGGRTEKEKDFKLGKHMKNGMSFDIGLEAFLGSVTYGLGYEYRDRNKYSPNGDDSTGIYFKVKASF